MIFECQACREEPCMPQKDDLSPWARLCGYGSSCIRLLEQWNEDDWANGTKNARWSNLFGGLDSTWSARRKRVTLIHPPFFDRTPESGKSYVACVHHPFIAKKAEHFWFLFQPPFSVINGWDACPEEIFSSHLLHVVLDRVLHREERFALIVVTVQETISVPAIHKTLPETSGVQPFGMFDDDFARRSHWVSWLNYVFVYWDPDSDTGAWWLFHETNPLAAQCITHMVLQGHWGWHDALIWAGNHRLADTEVQQLRCFMYS